MTARLIILPGTLCDQRLFAGLARRIRPDVAVRVVRWRELLRQRQPSWLEGPQPVSVLGFSLGGIWALQHLRQTDALQKVPAIERLALLGSNAEPATPSIRRRTRAQMRMLRREGTAAVARAAKAGYFAHRPPAWQARLVMKMARSTPKSIARRQLELAGRRADGLEAWSRFPGTVALWSGLQDRLCPPSVQQRLQGARRDALAQAWDRCGHMIPLEAPGRLALAIRRWLSDTNLEMPSASGVNPR